MLSGKFSVLFKDIVKTNTVKKLWKQTPGVWNFVSATDKYGILKKKSL